MSDIMLHGVLNMPPELWSDGPIDVMQRHSRYVQASQYIDELIEQRDKLAEALRKCREDSVCEQVRMEKCGYTSAANESQANIDRADEALQSLNPNEEQHIKVDYAAELIAAHHEIERLSYELNDPDAPEYPHPPHSRFLFLLVLPPLSILAAIYGIAWFFEETAIRIMKRMEKWGNSLEDWAEKKRQRS